MKASLRMLPQLLAEEALQSVERQAVGAGMLEKDTQARVLRAWQKTAGCEPTPQRATLADLGALGFGLVTVPPTTH